MKGNHSTNFHLKGKGSECVSQTSGRSSSTWVAFLNPPGPESALTLVCAVKYETHIPTWPCCCCLVSQPCLILCYPMDCSMPGFPVLFTIPQSLLRLMSIGGKSWLLFWSHFITITHKWKSSSITGWASSPGPSNPLPCTQAPVGIHFLINLGRLKPGRHFDKVKEEWE